MTKFDSAAFVICCCVTVTLKKGVARLIKALAICVAFGIENDIVYNEEKTKCMNVKPSVMKNLYVPTFHLGHLNIMVVEKETYLGYIIMMMMIT